MDCVDNKYCIIIIINSVFCTFVELELYIFMVSKADYKVPNMCSLS